MQPTGISQCILASGSPRRRELLTALGVDFVVVTSDAEEEEQYPSAEMLADLPPVAVALHDHPTIRAWRKGIHVAQQHPNACVLAADTIVVVDGEVLNKPVDDDDACRMLRRLSGQIHSVYTGVMLCAPASPPQWYVGHSRVEMRALSDMMIQQYVATGEPLDKAGAYGIQGVAGTLVQAVHGSFTNVVGLPLRLVHQVLAAQGVVVPIDPDTAYRNWRGQMAYQQMPDGSDI